MTKPAPDGAPPSLTLTYPPAPPPAKLSLYRDLDDGGNVVTELTVTPRKATGPLGGAFGNPNPVAVTVPLDDDELRALLLTVARLLYGGDITVTPEAVERAVRSTVPPTEPLALGAMTTHDVAATLLERYDGPLTATTPHGAHVFDVIGVVREDGSTGAVLRLREQQP